MKILAESILGKCKNPTETTSLIISSPAFIYPTLFTKTTKVNKHIPTTPTITSGDRKVTTLINSEIGFIGCAIAQMLDLIWGYRNLEIKVILYFLILPIKFSLAMQEKKMFLFFFASFFLFVFFFSLIAIYYLYLVLIILCKQM